MTAEQLDVCRNLAESASKAMKSKRMLRILDRLDAEGLIVFNPFDGSATLTDAGWLALSRSSADSATVGGEK